MGEIKAMIKKITQLIHTKSVTLSAIIIASLLLGDFSSSEATSRPTYVHDTASIIDPYYKSVLEEYLRAIDLATSAEIVIYTIPSFDRHGIMKDGHEIADRDMLANYLFNEVSLNGIKGIGKKDKDNGILILYSLKSDSAGGSMRLEIGRGLEGNITDGTAGNILDSYLVPARELYQSTGNRTVLNEALLNTVLAIGQHIGYSTTDPKYQLDKPSKSGDNFIEIILPIMLFSIIIIIAIAIFARKKDGVDGTVAAL